MTSLTIERDLPAEPAAVWRALTDPRELAQWFWPPRLEATIEADVRVGGRYRIASAPAEMAVGGEYHIVQAPTRLAFSWRWDGEEDESDVTIRLTRTDEGTHLALTHEGFSTTQARDDHVQGWQDCLERLPSHLQNHE